MGTSEQAADSCFLKEKGFAADAAAGPSSSRWGRQCPEHVRENLFTCEVSYGAPLGGVSLASHAQQTDDGVCGVFKPRIGDTNDEEYESLQDSDSAFDTLSQSMPPPLPLMPLNATAGHFWGSVRTPSIADSLLPRKLCGVGCPSTLLVNAFQLGPSLSAFVSLRKPNFGRPISCW